MFLFKILFEAQSGLGPSFRFTTFSGWIYLAAGILLMIWPSAVQHVFFDPEFEANEAALVRILGMTVAVIGWFYVFAGRAGATSFVAATVLSRLILVPMVLIPLAWQGVFPHLLLTFAILDPALALVALYFLGREYGV